MRSRKPMKTCGRLTLHGVVLAALLSVAPGCERTDEDVDRYRRDRNVGGLVKVLVDRRASMGLRTQAARALGEVGDERVLDPLCEAMLFEAEGHPASCEFQRAAAESLGQIGSPRAIPRLIEALRWRHVRWFAERALVKIGRPSVEPLIAALQNEDPAVREAVVVALGEIGDATAVPTLIPLLTVPEEEIRAAATRSLGLLKAPQAVGPLLEAKEKGLATFEYFEALGRIGGEAALHEILAAIESARYASQTWQALAAIGESAIPFVQGALVACPEDKRINYICALGEMSCPEATEALRRIQRGEADGHTLGQTVD